MGPEIKELNRKIFGQSQFAIREKIEHNQSIQYSNRTSESFSKELDPLLDWCNNRGFEEYDTRRIDIHRNVIARSNRMIVMSRLLSNRSVT